MLSNWAIASGLVASGSVYGPGLWRMCSRYFLARVQQLERQGPVCYPKGAYHLESSLRDEGPGREVVTTSIFRLCAACDLKRGRDTAGKGPVTELSSTGWSRDEQCGGVGGTDA